MSNYNWDGFWKERYIEERDAHHATLRDNAKIWATMREMQVDISLGEFLSALEKMVELVMDKQQAENGYNNQPQQNSQSLKKTTKKGVNIE